MDIHNSQFLSWFSFILVSFIETIWMEQFQLKFDWLLHWQLCQNKKKEMKDSFIKYLCLNPLSNDSCQGPLNVTIFAPEMADSILMKIESIFLVFITSRKFSKKKS